MKYNFEQKRNDYQTPPELYTMALEWVGADYFYLDTCCSKMNIDGQENLVVRTTKLLTFFILLTCSKSYFLCYTKVCDIF